MEIQSNLTVLGAVARRAATDLLVQFKVGQIVPATVVKTLADPGQAQLNIGGNLVRAQSSVVLTPGQTLELEVVESGNLPQLKIISPNTAEAVRQRALLNHIALQKSPALLSRQLLTFSKTAPGIDSIPTKVQNLAQSFLANLPDVRELATFQGIKQAIGESGIFLEARLASLAERGSESFDQDLKASLLRFAGRADAENQRQEIKTQNSNELAAQTSGPDSRLNRTLTESARGALSKIVLDQLASLPEGQPGRQAWNLEIPFLNSDQAESAKLTIQRETRTRFEEKEHQWSIVVELNPPNLGTLQTKISLSGNQINAYFRTETESTHKMIQGNLKLLEKQLNDAGLIAGNLASGTGLASENPIQSRVRNLFDERV